MTKRMGLLLCLPALTVHAQLPPPPSQPVTEAPAPKLYAPQRLVDLGKVFDGDRIPVIWRIQNQGTADLVIDRTQASCGCTLVALADQEKTVPPGGILNLKAEFDTTRRRGEQSKAVLVYSNDPIEPQLKLEFKALVEALYDVEPGDVLNLRALRPGETAGQTLDVVPVEGHEPLEILSIDFGEALALAYRVEPLPGPKPGAQRIRFTVTTDAPVGRLAGVATLRLRVAGKERQRALAVRGEVVGNLVWQPRVVDVTRQVSSRGKGLPPVTVRSMSKVPFKLSTTGAGPLVDASIVGVERAPPGTEYNVELSIADAAPTGPFGTMLTIRTDALDQPVINVPIYGNVSPVIEVTPPVILFDPTIGQVGLQRRLKLMAPMLEAFRVLEVSCSFPEVKAVVESDSAPIYPHINYIELELSPGSTVPRTGTVTIKTDLSAAPQLDVPVEVLPRR